VRLGWVAVIFFQRGNIAVRKEDKMETLQMIQQLQPAAVIAALVVLPWAATMIMHAVGASANGMHDDKWNSRAAAAVRWAGTIVPTYSRTNTVLNFAARRTARRYAFAADSAAEFFPHAA
jgi:hypothetical protein